MPQKNTPVKYQTFRRNPSRPVSSSATIKTLGDTIQCRQLEARNKILKNRISGKKVQQNSQLRQLQMLINDEQQMLMQKQKQIKHYQAKIQRLKKQIDAVPLIFETTEEA